MDQRGCRIGFSTRKGGTQTYYVLKKGYEALCAVPHRGGMLAEGVGDGAGVSVDISLGFFRRLTGREDLQLRRCDIEHLLRADNACKCWREILESLPPS